MYWCENFPCLASHNGVICTICLLRDIHCTVVCAFVISLGFQHNCSSKLHTVYVLEVTSRYGTFF